MVTSNPNIAVIVPTIREQHFSDFIDAWFDIFQKHDVDVFKVADGDDPSVYRVRASLCTDERVLKSGLSSTPALKRSELKPTVADLFSDHNPACRNLGFYAAGSRPVKYDAFITFDDDCLPHRFEDGGVFDAIEHHLGALNRRWPLSWMSSTNCEAFMRGMPYSIRGESEAVVSHGLWTGVPDFDAPTELLHRSEQTQNVAADIYPENWYAGPIPRGVFYPHCGMNVAFKREVLPWYYHCPVEDFVGAERFDDIWFGIELKKQIDDMPDKCIVSGMSFVHHSRASDPFKNLAKEAVGLQINETLWKGEIQDEYKPFFEGYQAKRESYAALLKPFV